MLVYIYGFQKWCHQEEQVDWQQCWGREVAMSQWKKSRLWVNGHWITVTSYLLFLWQFCGSVILWLCYFPDFSVGLTTVQDHFIPNYIFICSYIFIPITQGSHQTGTGLQRVQQLVPIPIPSCTHTVYPARFPDLCHSLGVSGRGWDSSNQAYIKLFQRSCKAWWLMGTSLPITSNNSDHRMTFGLVTGKAWWWQENHMQLT